MFCELSFILVCFNLCISVSPLPIYALCLLSCFVSLTLKTFPRYPTAQRTGKYLRCGPLELSASLTLPLFRVGLPGGSRRRTVKKRKKSLSSVTRRYTRNWKQLRPTYQCRICSWLAAVLNHNKTISVEQIQPMTEKCHYTISSSSEGWVKVHLEHWFLPKRTYLQDLNNCMLSRL